MRVTQQCDGTGVKEGSAKSDTQVVLNQRGKPVSAQFILVVQISHSKGPHA